MQEIVEELKYLSACGEALDWIGEQTFTSYDDLWQTCPRADWMLWLVDEKEPDIDKKVLVRISCELARTALYRLPENELRPLRAIETLERWLEGRATKEEVRGVDVETAIIYECGNVEAVVAAVEGALDIVRCSNASKDAARSASAAVHAVRPDLRKQQADIVRKDIPEVRWSRKL